MPTTESRPGLDGEALKLIAIFAMTVDHIAYAFVDNGTLLAIFMHAIGRITGPVMFYLAAEGYHHTRSVPRYILRLAVFALISFLPFQLFVYGRFGSTSCGLTSSIPSCWVFWRYGSGTKSGLCP